MSEYTPTTDDLFSWLLSITSEGEVRSVRRWLAERDRQVREELWDEIVPQYAHDWYWHDGGRELNPYRKDNTND